MQVVTQSAHIVFVVAVVLAVGVPGCRNDRIDPEQRQHMTGKTIQQVQEEHTLAWMTIPGVVGTAIGQCKGRPCILVLTTADTEEVRKKIPATVDGYPVVVQYSGEIRALDR